MPPSLQILSEACENALAESESTLQSSRVGWEHLGLLRSTADVKGYLWAATLFLALVKWIHIMELLSVYSYDIHDTYSRHAESFVYRQRDTWIFHVNWIEESWALADSFLMIQQCHYSREPWSAVRIVFNEIHFPDTREDSSRWIGGYFNVQIQQSFVNLHVSGTSGLLPQAIRRTSILPA